MDRIIPPGHASARQTEMGEMFDRTLFSALDAIESRQIPYALIGGIAASALSRPRSTHDIDLFVRPEDANAALSALEQHGFETERVDERWLFKGWKNTMMVDVIFKSQGDIYFDAEMQARARPIEYHGRQVPAVAPEDLVIIKCAVANEGGPHHWHDALAILSHAPLDWTYLLKRARRAARRVLAALIYAQSNDIWIPNWVIQQLFSSIFSERPQEDRGFEEKKESLPGPLKSPRENPETLHRRKAIIESQKVYLAEKIRQAITQDSRTAALDVQVSLMGSNLILRGEVQTEKQKDAITIIASELAPEFKIENRVLCCAVEAPTSIAEEVT